MKRLINQKLLLLWMFLSISCAFPAYAIPYSDVYNEALSDFESGNSRYYSNIYAESTNDKVLIACSLYDNGVILTQKFNFVIGWYGDQLIMQTDEPIEYARQARFALEMLDAVSISGNSQTEMAENIYTFVANTLEYDYTLKNSDAYDAFTHKTATCYGYYKIYRYLAEKTGIQTKAVRGYYNQYQAENHILLLLFLDSEWFYCDPTVLDSSHLGFTVTREPPSGFHVTRVYESELSY